MTIAARLLVITAVAILLACSTGEVTPPAGEPDPARTLLLGALPPAEAARGVYVVDLATAGDLNPGSRLAPLIAGLVDDAALLVETTAPPVTLLGGVTEDVAAPAEAVRVDDVIVLAEPAVRDAVAARLRDGAAPDAALAELVATTAPVAWWGPTPAPDGAGTTVVELAEEEVRFAVDHAGATAAAEEHARRQLAEAGPSGSPGKPWRTILADPVVTTEAGRLVITAVPEDLPGLFLRVLLDQRQLAFLPAG